jgi:hypothetical protein
MSITKKNIEQSRKKSKLKKKENVGSRWLLERVVMLEIGEVLQGIL